MAVKRNITVAIDAALLKRARSVAARRGSSVSALLADELRELVASESDYAAAERSARALLQAGLPLEGARISDRQALHDRSRLR